MASSRILYCHCAYANIIPESVKNEVLDRLTASGARFEAVADLCELSARRDPSLRRLAAGGGSLKIAACFPRSVKWLFAAAEAPLPADVEVRNMRSETAAETVAALLGQGAASTAAESAGSAPQRRGPESHAAASGASRRGKRDPSREAGSV